MTYARMLKVLKECKKELDKFYQAHENENNEKTRSGFSKKVDYMLEIKEDKRATLYRIVNGQTPIISGNSYEALLFALTYQVYFERLHNTILKKGKK